MRLFPRNVFLAGGQRSGRRFPHHPPGFRPHPQPGWFPGRFGGPGPCGLTLTRRAGRSLRNGRRWTTNREVAPGMSGLKDLPDEEVFWTEPYLSSPRKIWASPPRLSGKTGAWNMCSPSISCDIDHRLYPPGHHPTQQSLTDGGFIPETGAWWDCTRHKKFRDQESIRRALLLPVDEDSDSGIRAAVKKARR